MRCIVVVLAPRDRGAGIVERDHTNTDKIIAFEQDRVDCVHLGVEQRIDQLTARLNAEVAGRGPDLSAAARIMRSELNEWRAEQPPLCLGRFDHEDGETFYIGRRSFETECDEALIVVNWQAPMASAYYQATAADPCGLSLKRAFRLDPDQRTILDIAEQRWGDVADGDETGFTFEDLLLAELKTGRSGYLRDIVATIQAEQDRIIRLAADRPVVVQGGPGTGKTVVGLHRLSYLLFHDKTMAAEEVLVVGPNRVFLDYAGRVLPSLGDGDVRMATPAELALAAITRTARERVKVTRTDADEVVRLKGDARMAAVLGRAADEAVRLTGAGLHFTYGRASLTLGLADVRREIERLRSSGVALQGVRQHLLDGRRQVETGWVEDQLWAAYVKQTPKWDRIYKADGGRREFAAALRSNRGVTSRLNEILRVPDAVATVRRLLTDPAYLATCAAGILDEAEQELLVPRRTGRRGRRFAWSEADLPLVDEMAAHFRGVDVAYRHVLVDEAQDLSPMQARVIARRCRRGGGMTVLGDAAQVTGAGAALQTSWGELLTHLAPGAEAVAETLTTTYRVPAEILELARPVATQAAPQTVVPRSIRDGGRVLVGKPADDLRVALQEALSELEEQGGLVGVIVPRSLLAEVKSALEVMGVTFAEAPASAGAADVYLVPAELAKGLEFDHAVVVEPRAIVEDYARGDATLFVALTRPTKSLAIVRRRELPVVLGGPEDERHEAEPGPPPERRLLELEVEVARRGTEIEWLRVEKEDLLAQVAERDDLRRQLSDIAVEKSALERERNELQAHLRELVDELARLAASGRRLSAA
jgi:DNA helicase IV